MATPAARRASVAPAASAATTNCSKARSELPERRRVRSHQRQTRGPPPRPTPARKLQLSSEMACATVPLASAAAASSVEAVSIRPNPQPASNRPRRTRQGQRWIAEWPRWGFRAQEALLDGQKSDSNLKMPGQIQKRSRAGAFRDIATSRPRGQSRAPFPDGCATAGSTPLSLHVQRILAKQIPRRRVLVFETTGLPSPMSFSILSMALGRNIVPSATSLSSKALTRRRLAASARGTCDRSP